MDIRKSVLELDLPHSVLTVLNAFVTRADAVFPSRCFTHFDTHRTGKSMLTRRRNLSHAFRFKPIALPPFTLLLTALLGVVPHAQAQEAAKPAAGAASAASSNAGGANAITQAAVQKGALNCASRIEQVSNFLGFGQQTGALLLIPPAQPDQRLISLAMEVPTESGSAYVSASFAPNQANGCGAAYDAVVYWPQKCEAVAGKQFAALKKVGQLRKDITVLDGGMATKVFLMPAGDKGCIAIKKELVQ